MILSVSRRTDIPAFFSNWFMNRIREGYFIRLKPFNPKQRKRYSILPEEVEAIVFWMKNPKPLMKHLPELDSLGYRYYFQFTLNNYPLTFEPKVPSLKNRDQLHLFQ